MAQTQKVRGVATRVYDDEGGTSVQYHATVVVHFTEYTVTLNSGGWRTATTKVRMNQASSEFNLGYSVYGECGTREESDAHMARIQNIWTPEEVQHMCAACDEDCEGSFSWRPCECCESTLGGSRHRFVVLG